MPRFWALPGHFLLCLYCCALSASTLSHTLSTVISYCPPLVQVDTTAFFLKETEIFNREPRATTTTESANSLGCSTEGTNEGWGIRSWNSKTISVFWQLWGFGQTILCLLLLVHEPIMSYLPQCYSRYSKGSTKNNVSHTTGPHTTSKPVISWIIITVLDLCPFLWPFLFLLLNPSSFQKPVSTSVQFPSTNAEPGRRLYLSLIHHASCGSLMDPVCLSSDVLISILINVYWLIFGAYDRGSLYWPVSVV